MIETAEWASRGCERSEKPALPSHSASEHNLTMDRRKEGSERWRTNELRTISVFAYVFCVLTCCVAVSQQCAVGLTTPGRTIPSGDIILEHGRPLRILCTLNESSFIEAAFPGKSSRDLVFFNGHHPVGPEYISVLNETTIQLDVSRPPPENEMYYCKLRLDRKAYGKDYEAVCLNKVVVGTKPQEPRNFSCVSYNWESLTCSWQPLHNYIDTSYSITFRLPGRAGGRKLYPCPTDVMKTQEANKSIAEPRELKDYPKNSCYWDSTTNPLYRQPYEFYTFIVTGENVLGNWSSSYKFHHFANVVPAPPTNLTVANKTRESALLQWSVPFPMQTFPPGLYHRVAYQNQWDSRDEWQHIEITDEPHKSPRYYNLTGLKYANTIYDVRVYTKSSVAVSEDRWSNFSKATFRTPARVPGQPPRADVGSFEISENSVNRDVYLYWQTIPEWLENGNSFAYQVSAVEENGRRTFLTPNETTRTYAKFRGLNQQSSYRFEIVATNEVGTLDEPAVIFVPGRSHLPKEPVAFTKIAFDDTDGLFELSWKPPDSGDERIVNYTIFWCENDRDRPYQCQGYLEWMHVDKSSRVQNVSVPDPRKVYQFAISANTRDASSGMMWASCTVIHNKVVGKMKTVWINRIGSTNIEVGWKLDCSDRIGIVEAFRIYYCPIISPYNSSCKGPQLNTTIEADLNTIRGEVAGLKPYTTYMIAVSVLTKSGEGQPSDPLYNTTLESRPSEPPRDVLVSAVTNTTMRVEWQEPRAMNGVLRNYVVRYNEQSVQVDEETHVQLRGLLAARNYSVRVAACTVDCSAESEPIHVTTQMGVPGKIQQPNTRHVNSSRVKVTWARPRLPAGPVHFYQVRTNDGEIQNTTGREATVSIPDCDTIGRDKLFGFEVRAVNVAPTGEQLYGDWSDVAETTCLMPGPSYFVWVIIWLIGSIFGIAFVFCVAYSSKRMWLKCKAMQDVDIKLPPGLAPNMKLLQKGEQHVRQPSADSSGCSSGQESVTSSLTSDSQVSSDSGADLANNLMLDESSLRQRNVAARREPYSKLAKHIATDSLSLGSTPSLSDAAAAAAVSASPQARSSTGYISMPSSEQMSSDPSPVLGKEAAGYSVVGIVSSETPLRYRKSDEESISFAKSSNPYVTLASLEQQQKESRALHDAHSSSFDRRQQQPATSPSFFAQARLANQLAQKLTPDSKPYVTVVASLPEVTASVAASPAMPVALILPPIAMTTPTPTTKYVTVSSMIGASSAGQQPSSSMFHHARTASLDDDSAGFMGSEGSEKVCLYPPLDLQPREQLSQSSATSSALCWQPSEAKVTDFVTSQLSPAATAPPLPSLYQATKTASGYVTLPEQKSLPPSTFPARFAKPLQPTQQQSDEQYSKVAVNPRVLH